MLRSHRRSRELVALLSYYSRRVLSADCRCPGFFSKRKSPTGELTAAEQAEAEKAKQRADFAAHKTKEREKAEKAKAKAEPASGGSLLFGGKKFESANPAGVLKVHLVSAKGLKAVDEAQEGAKKGSSDPYVVVRLRDGGGGATGKQSAAVEKSVNPKFDETLDFDVRELQNLLTDDASLTFSLYDTNKNRISALDVSLGEAILQLGTLEWLRKKQSSPTKKTLTLSMQARLMLCARRSAH